MLCNCLYRIRAEQCRAPCTIHDSAAKRGSAVHGQQRHTRRCIRDDRRGSSHIRVPWLRCKQHILLNQQIRHLAEHIQHDQVEAQPPRQAPPRQRHIQRHEQQHSRLRKLRRHSDS